jgi:hypothetical protein
MVIRVNTSDQAKGHCKQKIDLEIQEVSFPWLDDRSKTLGFSPRAPSRRRGVATLRTFSRRNGACRRLLPTSAPTARRAGHSHRLCLRRISTTAAAARSKTAPAGAARDRAPKALNDAAPAAPPATGPSHRKATDRQAENDPAPCRASAKRSPSSLSDLTAVAGSR